MLLILSDIYSILLVVSIGFVISLLTVFLFRGYLFNLRQQVMAADMLTDIVSSFNKSIEQKEKRIVDLMMRVELLELKLGAGQSFIPSNTNVVSSSVMSSDVSVDINDITLSETELKVVKFLSDGPKRLFDVRQEIEKTREHTSRVVSSLVKKGILEKSTKDGQVLCQIRDRVLDKLDF